MGIGYTCLPGYYESAGPACTICAVSGCLACTTTGTVCLTAAGACPTGTVISSLTQSSSTTCVTCTAANCWICDPWDALWATISTTTCAVCSPGYILNAAKVCVACPVNCTNITVSGVPYLSPTYQSWAATVNSAWGLSGYLSYPGL
jgi:hypothetical protein